MADPLAGPPASSPAPAPGMKPWLRVVLGMSLAVNLLILGLVLGAVLRFGGPGDRPPPPTSVSMFRALPSDDRRDMRNMLREALPPSRDRRSESVCLKCASSGCVFSVHSYECCASSPPLRVVGAGGVERAADPLCLLRA